MKKINLLIVVLYALLSGCMSTGSAFFKTPTEQSIVSLTLGDYEEAINSSLKALQQDPTDPHALMVAGIAYDGLGFHNKSRRYFEDLVAINGTEVGMFHFFKNIPPEKLIDTAKRRLMLQETQQRPFAQVSAESGMAVFTPEGYKNSPAKPLKPLPAPTGLDMLTEQDRNAVERFLAFIDLLNEQLVTIEEFQTRRAVNLGALLPYTYAPAGLGMDLPAPETKEIINRLVALRTALELRTLTPREHAIERDIILEALLPSNPRRRLMPLPPPDNVLTAATSLRRIEMLQNLELITAKEANAEKKAVENLIYVKLGMTDSTKGSDGKDISACITKCMATPKVVYKDCPVISKPASKPVAKKQTTKKKAPVNPIDCPCAVKD